jgi:hypothetical protein
MGVEEERKKKDVTKRKPMRYKIFRLVENFFGCKGEEREKREQVFFKAVAEPHHFCALF